MILHINTAYFLRLCLISSLTVLLACSDDSQTEPAKKEIAADFSLKLFDGGQFHLSAHKGKPVLINFWASWCIPCAAEAPAIEKLYKEYRKKDVIFIGIAVNDTETKARQFVERFKLSFATGLDPGEIQKSYPIYGVPTTMFIDRQGRINYMHMGGVTENLIRVELDKVLE